MCVVTKPNDISLLNGRPRIELVRVRLVCGCEWVSVNSVPSLDQNVALGPPRYCIAESSGVTTAVLSAVGSVGRFATCESTCSKHAQQEGRVRARWLTTCH
jgi:hypothetical protein